MNARDVVYRLRPKNRPKLLISMIQTLASDDALIALEGRLSKTELIALEGAVFRETALLHRGTAAPRLDFVILPLTKANAPKIEKAIWSKIPFSDRGIVQVEIQVGGTLAFAAYDCFHEDCVVAYTTVSVDFLDELVTREILRSYKAA